MNCPICNVELKMADRQGIEVDYCPKCRGVWLDRGELDKIIERSGDGFRSAEYDHERHSEDGWGDRGDHRDEYAGPGRRPRKREGFPGEVFDIFG